MEFKKRERKTQRSKPESQDVADDASRGVEGDDGQTGRLSPSRAKELAELNWASFNLTQAVPGASVATLDQGLPQSLEDAVDSPTVTTLTSGANERPPPLDASVSREIFVKERGRLGDHLLDRHLITQVQLDQALAEQRESGQKLGNALVSIGALDELVLADVLGSFFGLVSLNLRRENIDADVLLLIPEVVARENLVIPIRFGEGGLHVAVAEPSEELSALLARTSGRPVRLMIAPMSDIRWAIDSNYRALGSVARLVQAFEAVEEARKRNVSGSESEILGDNAPVVQVVDRILTQAIRDRASDVHIEPSDDDVRIRFRIDGALTEVLKLPAAIGPVLVSRIKIMANMNIVERRRPQDGQLTITIDDKQVDVRVATVATIMGENCVMRILDKTRSVLRLSDLGMPADTHATYMKLVRAPFGMVLCAGPTGSGKTTTLYSTLGEVSDSKQNVMTIEDPVEYVFPSINQIQTNEQAGLNFATGLKSILRQDPDVILVGEIRDVETTRVAVQSALTGHFVISSMHATDSVSALHRLLDMGIESFLIASSVLGVVGQRLLRRICPSCKTRYTLSEEERIFYELSGGPEKTDFYQGTGCNFCSDTGYKDRIGIYELLVMTPEIKRLIVGWATQEELRELAVKQGMRTLRQEAISLVAHDVTSVAEVIRSVYTL
jgi:type IV pilus assembly protein PilB